MEKKIEEIFFKNAKFWTNVRNVYYCGWVSQFKKR